MKLGETLAKQGGINLIIKYVKSGVLHTAIGEFLLLGKSRTSLEILRLSTQLKIKQKLEKKYKNKLIEFDENYDKNCSQMQSNKVWICWFQGIDYAPELVKKCYQSIMDNLSQREIILITKENMNQYAQFPDYILSKWENGEITNTHMTDLLRLELLTRYGGLWLDATVLCTLDEKAIPSYYFDSDLFLYQTLKPGRDGHAHLISSWLMSAKSNNKILLATKYLCYEYWKANNEMIDYFLLHDFMSIVLEYYPDEWKKIIPRDNATPHILLLRLFDNYNDEIWQSIKCQTPFHKLSYKFDDEKLKLNNTFYSEVVKGDLR